MLRLHKLPQFADWYVYSSDESPIAVFRASLEEASKFREALREYNFSSREQQVRLLETIIDLITTKERLT